MELTRWQIFSLCLIACIFLAGVAALIWYAVSYGKKKPIRRLTLLQPVVSAAGVHLDPSVSKTVDSNEFKDFTGVRLNIDMKLNGTSDVRPGQSIVSAYEGSYTGPVTWYLRMHASDKEERELANPQSVGAPHNQLHWTVPSDACSESARLRVQATDPKIDASNAIVLFTITPTLAFEALDVPGQGIRIGSNVTLSMITDYTSDISYQVEVRGSADSTWKDVTSDTVSKGDSISWLVKEIVGAYYVRVSSTNLTPSLTVETKNVITVSTRDIECTSETSPGSVLQELCFKKDNDDGLSVLRTNTDVIFTWTLATPADVTLSMQVTPSNPKQGDKGVPPIIVANVAKLATANSFKWKIPDQYFQDNFPDSGFFNLTLTGSATGSNTIVCGARELVRSYIQISDFVKPIYTLNLPNSKNSKDAIWTVEFVMTVSDDTQLQGNEFTATFSTTRDMTNSVNGYVAVQFLYHRRYLCRIYANGYPSLNTDPTKPAYDLYLALTYTTFGTVIPVGPFLFMNQSLPSGFLPHATPTAQGNGFMQMSTDMKGLTFRSGTSYPLIFSVPMSVTGDHTLMLMVVFYTVDNSKHWILHSVAQYSTSPYSFTPPSGVRGNMQLLFADPVALGKDAPDIDNRDSDFIYYLTPNFWVEPPPPIITASFVEPYYARITYNSSDHLYTTNPSVRYVVKDITNTTKHMLITSALTTTDSMIIKLDETTEKRDYSCDLLFLTFTPIATYNVHFDRPVSTVPAAVSPFKGQLAVQVTGAKLKLMFVCQNVVSDQTLLEVLVESNRIPEVPCTPLSIDDSDSVMVETTVDIQKLLNIENYGKPMNIYLRLKPKTDDSTTWTIPMSPPNPQNNYIQATCYAPSQFTIPDIFLDVTGMTTPFSCNVVVEALGDSASLAYGIFIDGTLFPATLISNTFHASVTFAKPSTSSLVTCTFMAAGVEKATGTIQCITRPS